MRSYRDKAIQNIMINRKDIDILFVFVYYIIVLFLSV